MEKRFSLERPDVVNQLDKMRPADKDFPEKVRKFSEALEAVTCPTLNYREDTVSLLPRQYICAKNAFRDMMDGKLEDGWWEIYDFLTASEESVLTFAEMHMLCMLCELYAERLSD